MISVAYMDQPSSSLPHPIQNLQLQTNRVPCAKTGQLGGGAEGAFICHLVHKRCHLDQGKGGLEPQFKEGRAALPAQEEEQKASPCATLVPAWSPS